MRVLLLTKDDCDFCEHAKEAIAAVALDYPLELTELPLEGEEGKALALEARAPFPPVVFLDGELFAYGRLSERKLRKTLAKRSAAAS